MDIGKPFERGRLSRFMFLVGIIFCFAFFLLCEVKILGSAKFVQPITSRTHNVSCPSVAMPRRSNSETLSFSKKWKKTMTFVKKKKLSFLNPSAQNLHYRLLSEIESNGVPGMILECGVAKGGSGLLFASLKNEKRCLHLFDTFEGIPEPSTKDGADVHKRYKDIQNGKANFRKKSSEPQLSINTYYGYMDDLFEYVASIFKEASQKKLIDGKRVYLHKGLFSDTVYPNVSTAYAHLDGDWFVSVYEPLSRIVPVLSVGGFIVLDDVYAFSGSRRAMSEYFGIDLSSIRKDSRQLFTQRCLVRVSGLHFEVAFHERAYVKRIDDADALESLYPSCK